jgi:hypothetical protein
MREAFDQWQFVMAAYAIGGTVTLAMMIGSWTSMRRAEKRRDKVRER